MNCLRGTLLRSSCSKSSSSENSKQPAAAPAYFRARRVHKKADVGSRPHLPHVKRTTHINTTPSSRPWQLQRDQTSAHPEDDHACWRCRRCQYHGPYLGYNFLLLHCATMQNTEALLHRLPARSVPGVAISLVSFPAEIAPLLVEVATQNDGLGRRVPKQQASACKGGEQARKEAGVRGEDAEEKGSGKMRRQQARITGVIRGI